MGEENLQNQIYLQNQITLKMFSKYLHASSIV